MVAAVGLLALAIDGAINESTLRRDRYDYGLLNASLDFTTELDSSDVLADVILTSKHEPYLIRSSVIFGLTKVANESNVSPSCHAQLQQVQRESSPSNHGP